MKSHRSYPLRNAVDRNHLLNNGFEMVETVMMPDLQTTLTFGTAVSIERNGGTKLAVGASEKGNDLSNRSLNGNVYLMSQTTASSTWQHQSTITNVGGAYFSTSSSFDCIAVRHNLPNFVQVFNISNLTSPKKIGGDILGSAYGREVIISHDGTHVTVSSEMYNDKIGMVEFFKQAINGDWVNEGGLVGSESGGLFGWSIASSEDSSRIIVSSLGSESVRVYEKSKKSGWIQIGQTLSTFLPGDWYGFAVDISAFNGNTIAVGAPGNPANSSQDGTVQIYYFVGGEWKSRGAPLKRRGNFGYRVKLDNEGHRVVVSTKSRLDEVRIFDWEQNEWTPYKSSNMAKHVPQLAGLGLAITADGSRIVGASIKNGQTGVVEVYDTAVSISYPRQSPIESPIVSRSVESLTVTRAESLTTSPTTINEVQICQCSIELNCVENYKQIKENELFICLRSIAVDYHILAVRELTLKQGSKVVHRITNFTNDMHTWVTKLNASTTIRTRFDPIFFHKSLRGHKQQSVEVLGMAVLGTKDTLTSQIISFIVDVPLQGMKIVKTFVGKEFCMFILLGSFIVIAIFLVGSSIMWILGRVGNCKVVDVARPGNIHTTSISDKEQNEDSTQSEEVSASEDLVKT